MERIDIPLEQLGAEGTPPSEAQARAWCAQLEAGDILFFPQTPIHLNDDELGFLRGAQQTNSRMHKNVAYKPAADKVSGQDDAMPAEDLERLRAIMHKYSRAVTDFLSHFLSPYQRRWRLDYASFRPQEEENRDLPLRKRNDLLHTDAFPTRPTYGARILRFFNNINPERTRNWITTEPFADIAPKFAPNDLPLPGVQSGVGKMLRNAANFTGVAKAVPSLKRSPYDDFMMRFHNFLKENEAFQRDCPKQHWNFPPGSSWMVYTDTVSHAVLSGQYALEQTFLVAPEAMVRPEISPLGVLERLTGARLV